MSLNSSSVNFSSVDDFQIISQNLEKINEELQRASKEFVEFNKYFRDKFAEGMLVDAKDSYNKWRVGRVVSTGRNVIRIHFDAWDPKWDEDFHFKSEKLAPFRSHTEKSTGPENPTRNIFETKEICESLAHFRKELSLFRSQPISKFSADEITNFFRGELYIFIDHLLSFRYSQKDNPDINSFKKMTPTQSKDVMSFLHEYTEFFVEYLKNVKKIIPIYAEWISLKKPLLYLTSPVLAYLASFTELADLISKIFGKESKYLRFYENHDFEISEEALSQGYQLKSHKSSAVAFANLISSFLTKGGNLVLVEYVQSQFQIPVKNQEDEKAIFLPLKLLKSSKDIIDSLILNGPSSLKTDFIFRFYEHFIMRGQKLSKRDHRDYDPRSFLDIIESFSKNDETEKTENLILMFLIEFLQNPNLEKRMMAVNEINKIMEKCDQKKYKYLDNEKFKKYLIEKKLTEKIFGNFYHDEVAKKAMPIIALVTQENINPVDLDLLWKLTKTQNLEQQISVYSLLTEISRYQHFDGLEMIIEKLLNLQTVYYSEPLIHFIKDVTLLSVEANPGKSSTFGSSITNLISSKKKCKYEGFGIKLLHDAIQDSSNINPLLLPICCKDLGELLSHSSFKTEKEKYFSDVCLKILNLESVPQNLILFEAIVSSISNRYLWDSSSSSIENFIIKSTKDKILIDYIVLSLKSYEEMLEKKFFNVLIKDDTLIDKFQHKKQIMLRLEFLTFLSGKLSNKIGEITQEHLKIIWLTLLSSKINGINYMKEWILASLNGRKINFYSMLISVIGDTLEQIQLNIEIFELVELIFRVLNEKNQSIVIKRGIKVREFEQVRGIGYFWSIFKSTDDLKILDRCIGFFLSIYGKHYDHPISKYLILWEHFLQKIIEGLSHSNLSVIKMRAYFSLINQFLKYLDGKIYHGDSPAATFLSLLVVVKTANSILKEEVSLPTNTTISAMKKHIKKQFNLENTDFEITITHNLTNPYTFKWADEDDFNVGILESYKDKEKERDIVINVVKENSFTGLSAQIEKFLLKISSNKSIKSYLIKALSSNDESLIKEAWNLIQMFPIKNELKQIQNMKQYNNEEDWLNEIVRPSFRKIRYYLNQIEGILSIDENNFKIAWCKDFHNSKGLHALLNFLSEFNENMLVFEFDIEILNSLYWIIQQTLLYLEKNQVGAIVQTYSQQLTTTNFKIFDLLFIFWAKNNQCSRNISIFEGIFNNLFHILQYQKVPFQILADSIDFEILLTKYLTGVKSFQLAQLFSMAFKQFIKTMHESNASNVLQKLLQLLFKKNIMSTAEFGVQFYVYFDVANELMLNVDRNVLSSISGEIKTILTDLILLMVKANFDFEAGDQVIYSMLRFINGVGKIFSEMLKDLPNLKDLATFVFEKVLYFKKQNFNNNREAKNEGFHLLLHILKIDFEYFTQVKKFIEALLMQVSWRGKHTADWNLEPIFDQPCLSYTGLKNLGCTCYMNSLIQQLFMITEFREFIIKAPNLDAEKMSSKDNVLLQLQIVFANLKYSKLQYYDPRDFCGAIKNEEGNPINVLEQMDVDEFFNQITDKVEAGLKKSNHEKIIKRTFGGVECNELIGKEECTHNSENAQEFLTLTLGIKGCKSINESLDNMIKGDFLTGANAYDCESCEKKVTAFKRYCIKKLPNTLLLVLKRFDFDINRMMKNKLNNYCEFPLDLDMEKYTQAYTKKKEASQTAETEKNYPEPEYFKYKLKGVVVHMGTVDSGHYYSYINMQEEWYEFNDMYVKPFNIQDLPEEAFGGEEINSENSLTKELREKNRNAYLLFYERTVKYDEECNRIQNLTDGLSLENPDNFVFNEYTKMNQIRSVKKTLTDTYLLDFIIQIEEEFYLKEVPQNSSTSKELMNDQYLEINKLLLKYFFSVMIRMKQKNCIFKVLKKLKKNIQSSCKLSSWILLNFTSQDILQELLIECSIEDIKFCIVGLLNSAAKTLYNISRADIKASVLGQFIEQVYYCILKIKEYKLLHSFYRIILNFSSLGKECLSYLAELQLPHKIITILNKVDPYNPEFFKVVNMLKEKIEIQEYSLELPRKETMAQEEKILSYEEQVLKKKETNELARQVHQPSFIIETLAIILLDLDENEVFKQGEDKKIFWSEDFLYNLIAEAKTKSSINKVALLFKQKIQKNNDLFDLIINMFDKATLDKDEDLKQYLICIKYALSLEDANQETRIKKFLKFYQESLKKAVSFFRVSEILVDYAYKLCHLNCQFKKHFIADTPLVKFIRQWCTSFKSPRDVLLNQKLKIYSKRQVYSKKFLEMLPDSKFVDLAIERVETLNKILKGEISKEGQDNYWDSDTDFSTNVVNVGESYDVKFPVGIFSDPRTSEWKKFEICDTFQDMHEIKSSDSLANFYKWIKYDSDMAPAGKATEKYRNRFSYFFQLSSMN